MPTDHCQLKSTVLCSVFAHFDYDFDYRSNPPSRRLSTFLLTNLRLFSCSNLEFASILLLWIGTDSLLFITSLFRLWCPLPARLSPFFFLPPFLSHSLSVFGRLSVSVSCCLLCVVLCCTVVHCFSGAVFSCCCCSLTCFLNPVCPFVCQYKVSKRSRKKTVRPLSQCQCACLLQSLFWFCWFGSCSNFSNNSSSNKSPKWLAITLPNQAGSSDEMKREKRL